MARNPHKIIFYPGDKKWFFLYKTWPIQMVSIAMMTWLLKSLSFPLLQKQICRC